MSGHRCHWPGCPRDVPPRLWGCRPHWFRLPQAIRNEIWQHYRPGQERDKHPSVDYVAAARRARAYALEHPDPALAPPAEREPRTRTRCVAVDAGDPLGRVLVRETRKETTMPTEAQFRQEIRDNIDDAVLRHVRNNPGGTRTFAADSIIRRFRIEDPRDVAQVKRRIRRLEEVQAITARRTSRTTVQLWIRETAPAPPRPLL